MLFIFNTMLLKMLINATQNQRFFYGLKDIPISNFVFFCFVCFFFQRVRKVLFAEAVLGVENKKISELPVTSNLIFKTVAKASIFYNVWP